MKHFKLVGFLVIVVSILAGGSYYQNMIQANPDKYTHSTTPTLFFHGWGSSAHAEEHMVNAAKQAGVTKTIVRVNVDNHGRVSLHGNIPRKAVNPIVMVNFDDNKNSDYHQDGRYALNVIRALQGKYRFKRINLVGHSMGNMAIMFYLLDNAQKSGLPQLNKQVAIAGHFDGIKGRDLPDDLHVNHKTGQPNKVSPAYQQLLSLRSTYPKETKILNIYGDVGDGSDGQVTNDSSRTMRYIVANRAASYREKKVNGRNAQHSRLHSNATVDRALINFLWKK